MTQDQLDQIETLMMENVHQSNLALFEKIGAHQVQDPHYMGMGMGSANRAQARLWQSADRWQTVVYNTHVGDETYVHSFEVHDMNGNMLMYSSKEGDFTGVIVSDTAGGEYPLLRFMYCVGAVSKEMQAMQWDADLIDPVVRRAFMLTLIGYSMNTGDADMRGQLEHMSPYQTTEFNVVGKRVLTAGNNAQLLRPEMWADAVAKPAAPGSTFH